jgi:predicted metal-binding protein
VTHESETYEARKHAQKEQEMDQMAVSTYEKAAQLAFDLMQSEEAMFKQGYTFANALFAAIEHHNVASHISIAVIAEMLHERLMEQARASEACLGGE